MQHLLRRICILSLAAAMSSCATMGNKAQAPKPAQADPTVTAAIQAAKSNQASDYRIAPQDLIEVAVFQEDDINRAVRVDQTGKVNLPLVGTVVLGDLTVRQAEDTLQKAYSQYLIAPQVNVFIKEYHRKQVFILGEVQRPGPYDFPSEKGLTVIEAIALAGGFTKIAAADKTRVVRSENGDPMDIIVPAGTIMREGNRSQDLSLIPSDIIFVPQSFF